MSDHVAFFPGSDIEPEILRRFWALHREGFDAKDLLVTLRDFAHHENDVGPLVSVEPRAGLLPLLLSPDLRANPAFAVDCLRALLSPDEERIPCVWLGRADGRDVLLTFCALLVTPTAVRRWSRR